MPDSDKSNNSRKFVFVFKFVSVADVKIEISGNYPIEPSTKIKVFAEKEINLRIRMSSFVKNVTLNGEKQNFKAGTYFSISRKWQSDDVLMIEFDFSVSDSKSIKMQGQNIFITGIFLVKVFGKFKSFQIIEILIKEPFSLSEIFPVKRRNRSE